MCNIFEGTAEFNKSFVSKITQMSTLVYHRDMHISHDKLLVTILYIPECRTTTHFWSIRVSQYPISGLYETVTIAQNVAKAKNISVYYSIVIVNIFHYGHFFFYVSIHSKYQSLFVGLSLATLGVIQL